MEHLVLIKESMENIAKVGVALLALAGFQGKSLDSWVESIFTLYQIKIQVFEGTSLDFQPQKAQSVSSQGSLSAEGEGIAEQGCKDWY